MKFPHSIDTVAWSPCSRFIAIYLCSSLQIKILDSVTLVQLTTLQLPKDQKGPCRWLIFSPDSHLLTWFGYYQGASDLGEITTWDLQTGVLLSSIPGQWKASFHSLATYSACGTMFGALFYNPDNCILCIFNVLSGIHICTHPVKGPISGNIWISGECFQFATMGTRSVTTWEVGFAETNLPVEVETHSIPDSFHSPDVFLLHPTLHSLALIKGKSVCVWSTQDSKFLLDPINLDHNQEMSFSPDGHFFVCGKQTLGGKGLEILLWKESHTGYVPHQSLTSNLNVSKPLISPDGGSIIAFNCEAIQLWHTMDSSSPFTISAQGFQSNQNPNHFIVEFSPDQILAAIAQVEDEMVTILDLQSGIPRLIINAGMGVYGLGINGSSIVAISNGKIVTWNLPTENHIPGLRMDITNSAWTTTFNHGQFNNRGIPTALVPKFTLLYH